MSKVVVNMSLTLDGVMQAPGRPDEDPRGGFEHGGWALPYFDAVMGRVAAELIAKPPALLLGRRTYEDFYAVWPKRTDNPFSEVLNNAQKYVASTTLQEPLKWRNSTLLTGDAATAVANAQGAAGQRSRRPRQWSACPIADAAQPRGRVRALDPPAGARVGTSHLSRRQSLRRASTH